VRSFEAKKLTTIKFGKHKNKTLSQVLFSDPDWFYWAIENEIFKNKSAYYDEAKELNYKSRRIRIPSKNDRPQFVRYVFSDNGFYEFYFSYHGNNFVLDMSVPYRQAYYYKLGYKNFIYCLKKYILKDENIRMTKERCEDFFNDNQNFELDLDCFFHPKM